MFWNSTRVDIDLFFRRVLFIIYWWLYLLSDNMLLVLPPPIFPFVRKFNFLFFLFIHNDLFKIKLNFGFFKFLKIAVYISTTNLHLFIFNIISLLLINKLFLLLFFDNRLLFLCNTFLAWVACLLSFYFILDGNIVKDLLRFMESCSHKFLSLFLGKLYAIFIRI